MIGDIDLSRGKITTANLIFDAKLETDVIMTALDGKWSSVTLGENVKLQLTGNAPIPSPDKVTMANGSILYLHHAAEPAGIVKNGTAKVMIVNHSGHSLSKKEADCGTVGVSGNIEHWYCADATCPCYGLRYLDEAGTTPISAAAVEVTLGHDLTYVKKSESTCAIAGAVEHYHCEVCGRNFADKDGQNELASVVVPREAHNMTKVEQKAPTCTEDGVRYTHWHCSICNWNYKDEGGTELFTFSVVEPKTGHGDHLKKVEAQAASCTHDGVTAHWACEVCGKLYTDEVYNGSRLELTAEQIVKKSDHTLIKSEAVAATKDATGSIEYWYCDNSECVNYGRFFADADGKVEITDKNSVIIPKLTDAEESSGNFPVILVVVIVAVVAVAGIATAVVVVIKRRKV